VSNRASAKMTICNRLGMHARPAMTFVEVATGFAAKVAVRRTDQDEVVDGKSIMQMMMLAATKGTEIEVTAEGDDAEAAVARLAKLVSDGFDEE